MRLHKSSMKWSFWRWSGTPSAELERLYLAKTPWFAVAIHWVNKPADAVDMHDHPMAFFSIVLRGWYIEKRQNGYLGDVHFNWIRRWNYFPAIKMDRHRITNVCSKGAMTLVFEGPKIREWDFHTKAGWVHWREYLSK